MRVIRTYPKSYGELSGVRNYVDDTIGRVYIDNYDNMPLLELQDDLLILEWDIAISRDDLMTFIKECLHTPDEVISVPYRLYFESDPRLPERGIWSSQRIIDPTTLLSRWSYSTENTCDMTSFGCTYIPYDLLRKFADDGGYRPGDTRLTDTNFSLWHYRNVGRAIRLLWDVQPVHLHYDIDYATRKALNCNGT